MKTAISLLAMIAAVQPALAATPPCITQHEAAALFQVALPSVITGVSDKCRAALPSGAFLDSGSKAMVDRFRPASETAWVVAKPAISKMGGQEAKFLTSLPDDALKPLLSSIISSTLNEKITSEQCPVLNRLIESMAPLSSENVSTMLIALVELADGKQNSSSGKGSGLNICPSPAAKPAPISNATITPAAK